MRSGCSKLLWKNQQKRTRKKKKQTERLAWISVDAVVAAVLSAQDGIFTLKKKTKNHKHSREV